MNEQNAAIKPYVIGLDLGGTNSVYRRCPWRDQSHNSH